MDKMTTSENTSELNGIIEKIELKYLEPLLQQSLKNNELQVINFSSTYLLPPGENFASIVLKLDVKIRKDQLANEETLHLVAKTPRVSKNPTIAWPLVFKKELFMYVELAPLFKQLERDAGIEESELIDIWPEYIGHRNSLSDPEQIDGDSLILMENLKFRNFYTLDRRVGLNIHHARKALACLARYHALSIVMQEKRPTFANKAIDQARVLGINFSLIDAAYDNILKTFRETPCLQKHQNIIEWSFAQIKDGKNTKAEPAKPWAAITHGDFWTNNILFHKDDEGNVDDVKIVDFQIYFYSSPLKDVHYFLSTSLERVITEKDQFDELINLYYDTFIETLKRMNCDSSPFTKASFILELKKHAINEFPFCALAIKIFEFEFSDNGSSDGDINYVMMLTEVNDSYINKLRDLVEIYEKLGWF